MMRFTKEAIREGRHTVPISRMVEKFGKQNVHVAFYNENNRFPAYAQVIVDITLQNMQKRTVNKAVKSIDVLIDGSDLDEGFIEIYAPNDNDVLDLLPMEEDMKACKP